MLIIGLTGSIATGKSTVSKLLASPPYSLTVIDADVLAREVVEPGTSGYRAIVAHFGPSTPDLLLPAESSSSSSSSSNNNNNNTTTTTTTTTSNKGRPLNRAALGRRVFGTSPEAQRERKVLNGIVHPAVRRAMATAMLKAYITGQQAVILDVPLLFDSGLDIFCGAVLVVGVRDPQVQLNRLLARDAAQGGCLSESEAKDRVASQGDVKSKVARVRVRGQPEDGWGEVVWNDGDREQLAAEVKRAMAHLKGKSPWWWGLALWVCPPLALVMALRAFLWARTARRRYESEQKAK